MPSSPTKLTLAKIRRDGGTQPRADIDAETVAQYRERMEEGDKFPPVVVFFDGKDHWLADGFHRVDAAETAGWKSIEAEIQRGTRRDAILYSVGANNSHGKPRTNADKRRAVATVLTNELVCKSESGAPWSDRAIGRLCKVSEHLVKDVRSVTADSRSEERAYTTKHGTVTTMKTGNIGRKPGPITPDEVADNNEYFESVGMGAGEPAAPKRINIKRSGESEDPFEGGVVTTLERPVTHTTTAKPKNVTALDVIAMVKKAIWGVYQSAPEEFRPIVAPKFKDFAGELERTGDLSW